MSLDIAKAMADAQPARIVRSDAKVVTLDIERLPGRARHQHRGLTIEGDFWDLNSWKHTLGYRLPAESVIEWPRTVCAAFKWYHSPRVEFVAEWQNGGPAEMHAQLWRVFDEADIVTGHAMKAFDSKHLNTGWRNLKLPPPSPYKIVDTLTESRRRFGDESMKLNTLCERMGLEAKTDKYSVSVTRAACEGNRTAQRKLRAYNVGDIRASEALYDAIRPWLDNHPHIGTLDESEQRCNACGSGDLERTGSVLAIQIRYQGWRCKTCGANLRGAQHSRAANVRGAR